MEVYAPAALPITTITSTKRNRSSSQSSTASNSSPHTAYKSTRISTSPPSQGSQSSSLASSNATLNANDSVGSGSLSSTTTSHRLLCTLPPTCNHRPTPLSNTGELESHYATYHAHVCEQYGCGCVFPDGRLLELHQTENHDPLASLRKERGEKIFACHIATCPRLFLTPKARRLHLISAHNYPKQYFFAVTNKGVGGLLKKWGEGASMIRGDWKSREKEQGDGIQGAGIEEVKNEVMSEKMDLDPQAYREKMDVDEEDDEDSEEDDDSDDSNGVTSTSSSNETNAQGMHSNHTQRPNTLHSHNASYRPATVPPNKNLSTVSSVDPLATPRPPPSSTLPLADEADTLAHNLSSLALVPPSIRFGRGGKLSGFGHGAKDVFYNANRQPEAPAQHQSKGSASKEQSQGPEQEARSSDLSTSPTATTQYSGGSPRGGRGRGLVRGGVRGRGGVSHRGAIDGLARVIPGRGRGRARGGPPFNRSADIDVEGASFAGRGARGRGFGGRARGRGRIATRGG